MAQPGHPLYSTQVEILAMRKSATYDRCVIADPDHPSFHYHIKRRWLSETPPAQAASANVSEDPVFIALPALDRLVQRILSRDELRRTNRHAANKLQGPTALAADTPDADKAFEPTPFPDREEDSRRATS